MLLNLQDILWAGTQASLDAALDAEDRLSCALKSSIFTEDEPPQMFSRSGNVAIIPIKGPLVNADNPWLAFFGVTSYPSIRRSLVAAATDRSIEQILLDIDSGGGAVAGVADTGDLIARINKSVKPVTTFADGTMASAAYWLGCSAQAVFVSKTTISGSIGISVTHMDRSQQLAQAGIKPHVFRGGKFKALLNPLEPLTEAAIAQMDAMIDAAYTVFVQHVADSCGVSYAVAHSNMADGREFFGAGAVKAGLADAVTTFDALLSKLREKKG